MNVCLVEDDKVVLDSLKQLLLGEPGIKIVGSHDSAESALAHVLWKDVEILLVDLGLPGISGAELIRRVRSINPSIEAMAFTGCENQAMVMDAIRAGASGYLLKGSTPRFLIESLRELYAGGAPMTPKIARKVLLEFRGQASPGDKPRTPEDCGLTHREMEILRRIELGQSYGEIGEGLSISPHTVHTHIKHIYEKIHAFSRSDLLLKARRMGMI